MCTYVTEHVPLRDSSGKAPAGWMTLTEATVYYDHPVHAPLGHAVNIDFRDPNGSPGARVAVELSVESAQALIAALQKTVELAAHHR